MKEFDIEEDFHKKERKMFKKERKIAQDKDRSKYKLSDRNKTESSKVEKSSLAKGRVISITGQGILVRHEQKDFFCSLKGSLKKEITRKRNLVVVGDFVYFNKLSSKEGQIIDVESRFSQLERTDISGRKRQLLAANIDAVFITGSVVLPPLKPSLIDRYIIAAKKGNMQPVILINKIDLLENDLEERLKFEEFLSAYDDLPIYPISCKTGEGTEALKAFMQKNTTVFSGQSGVGKSSLINFALDLDLPIGEIVYKGKHTTTKAHLIPIGKEGFCIDTPGIRRFGLWDLTKKDVIDRFEKITFFAKNCKYQNCLHINEPKCGVKQALHEGKLSQLLYESYTKLLDEASQSAYWE